MNGAIWLRVVTASMCCDYAVQPLGPFVLISEFLVIGTAYIIICHFYFNYIIKKSKNEPGSLS